MIKKILMIMLVGIILVSVMSVTVVSAEDDFPVLNKQVEVRKAHYKWSAKVKEISTEASVEYIKEINGSTVQLSSYLDDIQDNVGQLDGLTTHVAFNNLVRQTIQVMNSIRLELLKQIRQNQGSVADLREHIQEALDENEDELEGLKDDYWVLRKLNALAIFDLRIERAQNILDRLDNMDYDATEAQAKLDEINDKRSELEEALNSREAQEIRRVNMDIFEMSKELRQIVKDLQVEIPEEDRIRHLISLGDRAVVRSATIISELENIGIDVSELEEIHSKAETDIQKAKDEFEAGNLEEAKTALEDLREDLVELRDKYREIVFPGSASDDMRGKVEATATSLDKAVGDIKKVV